MRARLARVLGVAFALLLRPLAADAQLGAFVEAVREVADANGRTDASRATALRAAAGRLETALAEWDRQIADLEAAVARQIRTAPDDVAYQLHVQLGVAYRVRGRRADALREFDAAAPLKPSASDIHVLQALTYEADRRTEEARRAFLLAWQAAPHDPVKAYYVAVRPGDAGAEERARARAALTEAFRSLAFGSAPPAAPPFVMLDAVPDTLSRAPVVGDDATAPAFALLNAGRFREGIAALERMDRAKAEQRDDSPLAHFARGQRDEAENRVGDAQREYDAALGGTLIGRGALLIGIARLAQVDGDLAGAIDAFTGAVLLNPNDPNIHKELAGAYAAQGRTDEAFCELMAALLIDARDPQAHAAIGQLRLDAGHNAEAVATLERALALNPDRYEIRYALATAYTRLGNTAEAARQLALFDRASRQALDERRRALAHDVEQEEAVRRGLSNQGSAR